MHGYLDMPLVLGMEGSGGKRKIILFTAPCYNVGTVSFMLYKAGMSDNSPLITVMGISFEPALVSFIQGLASPLQPSLLTEEMVSFDYQ